jgi:hypothetical protein
MSRHEKLNNDYSDAVFEFNEPTPTEEFEGLEDGIKERILWIRSEMAVTKNKEILRQAEKNMIMFAGQLMHLLETKARAIENEDYQTAKEAKTQYDEIKHMCLSFDQTTVSFPKLVEGVKK